VINFPNNDYFLIIFFYVYLLFIDFTRPGTETAASGMVVKKMVNSDSKVQYKGKIA
jgi:hypothetical protein